LIQIKNKRHENHTQTLSHSGAFKFYKLKINIYAI